MLKNESKTGRNIGAVIGILVFLCVVIVLENLASMVSVIPTILLPTSPLFTVLKKGAVYALLAVSMNLLNGFTGLFSLGQAGFMLLGAYTFAIFTVPMDVKAQVYYRFDGSAMKFSLTDLFQGMLGDNMGALALTVLVGIILAGLVAALFAALIGTPVLRLKSDYLAIATLGFAEILRAIFQWETLGPITNGANMIKNFPTFASFNFRLKSDLTLFGYDLMKKGQMFRLSTFVPFLIAVICIVLIVLLINSSYGRAFKSIRDDEIAAEAMGINLFKHKMMSFVSSSFFAGVGGALFAMYVANAQAKVYTSTITYEILLIVVIGGIGSISGSVLGTFLYVACSEWWLRFLDAETYIGAFKVPLLRPGFRMVVFSVVIMIIVLFFSKGIMGDKELSFKGIAGLFQKKPKKKAAQQQKGEGNHNG